MPVRPLRQRLRKRHRRRARSGRRRHAKPIRLRRRHFDDDRPRASSRLRRSHRARRAHRTREHGAVPEVRKLHRCAHDPGRIRRGIERIRCARRRQPRRLGHARRQREIPNEVKHLGLTHGRRRARRSVVDACRPRRHQHVVIGRRRNAAAARKAREAFHASLRPSVHAQCRHHLHRGHRVVIEDGRRHFRRPAVKRIDQLTLRRIDEVQVVPLVVRAQQTSRGQQGEYSGRGRAEEGHRRAPCAPIGRRQLFPNNSSACASALFALLSPSMRASSVTRVFRLAWMGAMLTIARSFD